MTRCRNHVSDIFVLCAFLINKCDTDWEPPDVPAHRRFDRAKEHPFSWEQELGRNPIDEPDSRHFLPAMEQQLGRNPINEANNFQSVPALEQQPNRGSINESDSRQFVPGGDEQSNRDPASYEQWTRCFEQLEELKQARKRRQVVADKNFEQRLAQLTAERRHTYAEIEKEMDKEEKLVKDSFLKPMDNPGSPGLATFFGHEQPAGPSHGSGMMNPLGSFGQIDSEQLPSLSFAETNFPNPRGLISLPALHQSPATVAPWVGQASGSQYDPSYQPTDNGHIRTPFSYDEYIDPNSYG